MGHRHWFVILTTDEGEYRSGPYPSRTSAERNARERDRHAPADAVKVVYDPGPSAPRSRRWWARASADVGGLPCWERDCRLAPTSTQGSI